MAAAAEEPATAPADGELVVRVVDPDGEAVPGVRVGSCREQWDYFNRERVERFGSLVLWNVGYRRTPPEVTGGDGTATISLKGASRTCLKRALYALAPARGLVELAEPPGDPPPKRLDVNLQPACLVRGRIASAALRERKIPMLISETSLYWNGERVLSHCSTQSRFEFILPPGAYKLQLDGDGLGVGKAGSGGVVLERREVFFTVKPGKRDLDLGTFDLDLTGPGSLVGAQAPELRNIRGWKGSKPRRLSDLRGKYVLVNFWGYTCPSCVVNMPFLFGIHDRYSDHGLVIIGVHDKTAGSIQEMDEKLSKSKTRFWSNRDIPYPVALDRGSGPYGDTHRAYKVTKHPTSVLIDPAGKVVHVFHGAAASWSFFDDVLKVER
ncbi:MAG TPA: TlpA disulfide reductase family protein [Phycisphaerae bacterium]|nr:TlpA disulfide reductase family protein [Phycisphaerae bacterium]